MHISRRLMIWGACLFALEGCTNDGGAGSGTLGQQGRIEFSYQRGCFFGCPLEQPLLVGTRQTINVDGPGDVAGVEIASSKPKIAEFALERACYCERVDHSGGRLDIAEDARCDGVWQKHCDNTLLVQAKAAGETRLELRDKSGQLIDEVPVIVHEAARAKLEVTYPDRLGAVEAKSLALKVGDKVELDLSLYDAMGRKLLAPDGVSWSVDDDQVAIVTAWLIGSGQHVSAGLGIEVQATAAGATGLTISVPGIEKTIDIVVTEP